MAPRMDPLDIVGYWCLYYTALMFGFLLIGILSPIHCPRRRAPYRQPFGTVGTMAVVIMPLFFAVLSQSYWQTVLAGLTSGLLLYLDDAEYIIGLAQQAMNVLGRATGLRR